MISLTRLNRKEFFLNCDLIEMVEETPDTLITMTTGKKFLVVNTADEILSKIIVFRNQCFREVTVQIQRKSEVRNHECGREIDESVLASDAGASPIEEV